MPLELVRSATLAGAPLNEDRVGHARNVAWVIDGATDVIEAPLTGAKTDADWLAGELDAVLRDHADRLPDDLARLPQLTASLLARRFAGAKRREPAGRHEHPSASALIVRLVDTRLDYVAIGDCELIGESAGRLLRVATEKTSAGDRQVAQLVADFNDTHVAANAAQMRAHAWPIIRAGRARMNEPDGYGVFSITPTPPQHVRSGSFELEFGATLMLASDGILRLVDVFHRYTHADLLAAARERGFEPLLEELRAFEHGDADCRAYPRAKVFDDASALLLRIA